MPPATRQSSNATEESCSDLCHPGISLQATQSDRQNWKGWCEIESEPAFFNMMLKQLGVQGVKVCEVFSFDEDMLQSLPQPVHGLIFLSRWQEDTVTENRKSDDTTQKVWFANQTVDNACATLALLNIINNVEDIELGDHLSQFKDFTSSFTPELRGEAVGNFEFVRQVHNSFARKIDMMNGDLCMAYEANRDDKGKGRRSKSRSIGHEASYHFDAFIPIGGELWKLDGLESHPRSLGTVSPSNWLLKVKSTLEGRIATYEANAVEFAVLGVVRHPLPKLVLELASNIERLRHLDAVLDLRCSTWRESWTELRHGEQADRTLLGPDESYGIHEDLLSNSHIPVLESGLASQSTDDILLSRVRLAEEQEKLRTSVVQEREAFLSDEAKCEGRKFDYSSVLYDWLKFLLRNGTMKEIVDMT